MPAVVTFERLLENLKPRLRKAIRANVERHPYLGEDDLFQDGVIAVWQVWSKYAETKPLDDLCAMSFVAAMRKVITRRKQAWSRGEGLVNWVDLDADATYDKSEGGQGPNRVGTRVSNYVAAPAEHERAFLRMAIQELDDVLSEAGAALLREKLNPGVRTLEAVRRLWAARLNKNTPWHGIDYDVYAESLGMTKAAVREAMAEIRWKNSALEEIAKAQHVGLLLTEGDHTLTPKGEPMEGKKAFVGVPDPMDLEEAPPAEAAPPDIDLDSPPPAEEGKREEAKAATTPKPKAEPKEPKAPKAKKAAAPKAKKSTAKPSKVKAERKPFVGGAARPRKPKAKVAKGDVKGGIFRDGSKSAAAWALLQSRFRGGATFKRDAVAKACASVSKVDEAQAVNKAAGLTHTLLQKGLIKRVGTGEFKIS